MSKKILIAEDSLTMRSLIVSTIAAMGDYDTVEAANGFEALRILPREKVDLIITDINMPDINGLELVSFIRNNESYKETPLLSSAPKAASATVKRAWPSVPMLILSNPSLRTSCSS